MRPDEDRDASTVVNRLGVRLMMVDLSAIGVSPSGPDSKVEALEWTVDGAPLRAVLRNLGIGDTDVPHLRRDVPVSARTEALERLRGDRADLPTLVPRFDRSLLDRLLGRRGIPFAPSGPAFEDGRVVLVECPCRDLDCGALSTEVVLHPDHVDWRDIGCQVTYEPFASSDVPVRTLRFDRRQYTALIDRLLASDWV
ncbi:MAG: hypothetical protein PGN07_03645 [Aeromicrobium erythreum]